MIALLTFMGIFLAWLVFGSIIAKIFGRTVRTWVSGNWTLYMDIPVPFTRYVLCCDIGKHRHFGYRYKR